MARCDQRWESTHVGGSSRGYRPHLWIVALLLLAATPTRSAEPESGLTHALLLNGGSRPAANYQSHLHHLEDMLALLGARGLPRERVHIFSADGEDPEPDLAVRDARSAAFWLLEGTRIGSRLRPRTEVTDTRWEGVTLRPAREEELRDWFEEMRRTLVPGDRLLVFVTDHGTGNDDDPDNGAISLWQEELTVEELRELLALLAPGVRVVMVMSQCYSGAFANAMYAVGSTEPSGDACGFFSTTRDLRAFGCYPEGRDRDRLGHAFHFIDALGRQNTTAEAHLEVLVTDDSPDVPLRTSDVYLERLVAEEAAARGLELEMLVDTLLAEAWRDRAGWEPQIRLLDRIGHAFGTFSPRGLAELERQASQLPALSERMETYAERWKTALVGVKEEALRDFLGERPGWRERLDDAALKKLAAETRKGLLEELLPELEAFARDRASLWQRLEDIGDRARRASAARWRLDVRHGAALRMRSILIGIAGRVLLAGESDSAAAADARERQRAALERLASCEELEPGVLPPPTSGSAARPSSSEPYPPLADELRLAEEVLPSWLGVRFGSVPESARAKRGLAAGAALLQAVYPDSPAQEAGLQAGDIVLGPPKSPFDAPGQLREWTMTSPRETPLELRVLRPGARIEEDREVAAEIRLGALPLEWPELPGPPQVGDTVPPLPSGLLPVGSDGLPELGGRPHLLFFWATWCLPCKRAVPEVMAFAAARGLPVLAITDEDGELVSDHLRSRREAFFDRVAVDPLRKSFIAYGVSGTPTIVLVDEAGVVRHRQVGYEPATGLTVDGWSWTGS